MILNILPYLSFSQSQPLKLADDWHIRILEIKIKSKNVLDEIKGIKKINRLKTKRNLLYIRNQSVPRCKHFTTIIKINQLTMYRAKVAVCFEIHTKHSMQRELLVVFSNVKLGGA
jgi:hypothetical protein